MGVFSQSNARSEERVDYLALKNLFKSYEDNLLGMMSERDPNVRDRIEDDFLGLFLTPQVPVYDFFDRDAYATVPVNEFVAEMDQLWDHHVRLRMDELRGPSEDPNFPLSLRYVLDDFEIVRETRRGVITAEVTQYFTLYSLEDDRESLHTDRLFFTLIYDQQSRHDPQFKISRIDRADYAFVDGVGSSFLLPNSIDFRTSLDAFAVSDNPHAHDGYFGQPTPGFSLELNYDLYGTDRYNLQFSTGIMYHRLRQNFLFNGPEPFVFQKATDVDGQDFDLMVFGSDYGHGFSVDFAGIPLLLKNTFHLGKHQLSLNMGLGIMYPFHDDFAPPDRGQLYLQGKYDFPEYGNQPLIIDFAEYGFGHHDHGQLGSIYEPDFRRQVSGLISLRYSQYVSDKFQISFGPDFQFAFSDLINEAPHPAIVNEGAEVIGLNLLAMDDRNMWSGFGFSAGIAYQLQRPNVPYQENVSYRDARSHLRRIRKPAVDEDQPPLNIYVVNRYVEGAEDEVFDRRAFANHVVNDNIRPSMQKGEDVVVYIPYDDIAFVNAGSDEFDDRDLYTELLSTTFDGSYGAMIGEEVTAFIDTLLYKEYDIGTVDRNIRFHVMLATPASNNYQDALSFIHDVSMNLFQDAYRKKQIYFHTPLTHYINQVRTEGRDIGAHVNMLKNAMESQRVTPENFDYNFRNIIMN